MHIRMTLLALAVLLAAPLSARPARRALLIGIDDYTASTLPRVGPADPNRERGWSDLKGAANDATILAEMLVLLYGFEREDVVVLKNQQATRGAIVGAIERHLVAPARKGDIAFYYFAGHGAQVPNAASDEPDGLDESIVPADARRGAADIRDKELRPLFNRILDAGAQLTLVLDHCHSGSSFRAGMRPRGIGRAAPIVDAQSYGPRPDERGALVLSATQDLDEAWEARGEDGRIHGAFTWAWIRALRDAAPGEPAQETFLRAQALMRAEAPDQAPAMLGRAEARLRPFLDAQIESDRRRTVVAVERVEEDGHVVLQGGWANGLAAGSELRLLGARGTPPRLRVAKILGLGRSIARMQPEGAVPPAVRSGALLEIVLRRVDTWSSLRTPPGMAAPYRLAIRHESTRELVRGERIAGGDVYTIVLRAAEPRIEERTPRYYYVFVVDGHGQGHLLFPRTGSVENRFPIRGSAPAEIPLGPPSAFRVVAPYGVDTYYLLSTDEPLPNPSILEWDDVRARRVLTASRWSIERITLVSAAPAHRPASAVRDGARRR